MTQGRKYLNIIDARSLDWGKKLDRQNVSGSNFFLVAALESRPVSELCKCFQSTPQAFPRQLTRSNLFSLSRYLSPEHFDALMLAHQTGAAIFFVDQLDLPITCPPRVKPYLLYCSAQGILSQHERMPEARRAYYDYLLHSDPALGIFPGAGIYKWQDERWRALSAH